MSIQLTVMSLDFDSTGAPTTTVINKKIITLGRGKENDVVLDRPEVSEIHARLRVDPTMEGDDAALYITDLGSSNGTLVENNSLKSDIEVKMLPNERIIIGNYLIKPTVIREGIAESDTDETEETTLAWTFTEIGKSTFDSAEEHATNGSEHGSNGTNGTNGAHAHSHADIETPYAEDLDRLAKPEVAPTIALGEETREAPVAHSKTHDDSPGAVTILLDGAEVSELDFIATELFTVHGVVSHKGNPLSGVEVHAGTLGSAQTGPEGTYRFTDVAEGTEYIITAAKQGYIFDCSAANGTVSSDVVRPIAATELFPISVAVIHKGQPLAGVTVDAGPLGNFQTDSQGTYTIKDVPEGSDYRLGLSKDKFLFEPAELSGTVGNDAVTVNSYARELFSINGRVMHRSTPLAGVTVDGGKLGTTTTDSDGGYRFENVPEGEQYTIRVAKQKFRIRRK